MQSSTSSNRLSEISKRYAATTPGTWYWDADGDLMALIEDGMSTPETVLTTNCWERAQFGGIAPEREADAEFIVHARQDIAFLLAEVARLERDSAI